MLLIKFRLRKGAVITAVLGVITLIVTVCLFASATSTPKGKDILDRTAYLSFLGYTVDDGSEIKTEIKIPQNFSKIYSEYNDTQKVAGYDLAEYSGQQAIMYTYSLSGFKDYRNVYANLIVVDGKIIGGDISSIENGGFTLPLINKDKQ